MKGPVKPDSFAKVPKDKYHKMETCAYRIYVNDFMDYCMYLRMEFPCDAPTDCPLWNECEDCEHWKPKDETVK